MTLYFGPPSRGRKAVCNMDLRLKQAVVGALHQRGRLLCAGDDPRTAPILGEPVYTLPAPDGWRDIK